jgi:uncharacterized protein (TIGR02147 family)
MNSFSNAKNTKEFLHLWFQSLKEKKPNISYEAIAVKTGYASRSFVRQVITGQKPLTAKSLPRFLTVMNLDKNHETLFRLLLEKENPSLSFSAKDTKTLDLEIQKVRQKIQIKKTKQITPTTATAATIKKANIIYPLLSQSKGISLDDLSLNAKLTLDDCKEFLKVLEKQNFVSKSGKFFYATERLLQVQATDKVEMLKSHVRTGLFLFQEALNLPDSHIQEQLLFRAQYSIRKEQIEDFKNKLRSLLVEFVETTEDDESEKVVNLVCGLF